MYRDGKKVCVLGCVIHLLAASDRGGEFTQPRTLFWPSLYNSLIKFVGISFNLNSICLNHQAVPGGWWRHTVLRSRHAKGLFATTLHRRAGRNTNEGVWTRGGEGGDQVCLWYAHGRGQDGVKVQVLGSISCHNGKNSRKIPSGGICNLSSNQWG